MKSLIVILCTYILFLLIPGNEQMTHKVKMPSHHAQSQNSPTGLELAQAFVLGDKKGLSSVNLAVYLELGLLHLFTLSGLHLKFFNTPFRLLTKLSHRLMLVRHPWLILQVTYFLFLIPFWPYPSMRRVLFFCLFNNFLTNLTRLTTPKNLAFTLAFVFDFLLGSYTQNPYSFTLSFLFLGLLVHHHNKLELAIGFLSGYFLVNLMLGQNINYLGFAVGQFFTWLFSPFFLLAISHMVSVKLSAFAWIKSETATLLQLTHSCLAQASAYSASLKGWEIGFFPLLALGYLAFRDKIPKVILIGILSFFYFTPIENYQWSDPSRLHFFHQYLSIKQKKYTPAGEEIIFSGGLVCQTYYNQELDCHRN